MVQLRSAIFGVFTLSLVACGSSPAPAAPSETAATSSASTPPPAPTTSATAPASSAPAASGDAKEGESCGDGVLGAPNRACAAGLTCDRSGAQRPPAGAQSSAPVGTCRKAK